MLWLVRAGGWHSEATEWTDHPNSILLPTPALLWTLLRCCRTQSGNTSLLHGRIQRLLNSLSDQVLSPSEEASILFVNMLEYKRASQVALAVMNPPANGGDTGDSGWIPGLGRSLGEGNGNPLQYPCLENLMDKGAWQATVCGVAKSQT